ncbi:hypothetical protein BDR06DRAFT_1016375 [Suillus hirtellus]|nr:hypothetical protein BDR06DRAFT_1016375 [Suillus hirtellus]
MISTTTLTRAARVALQGYLTAAFFKEIVIDRTIKVVSRSEKVSISLVTSTVCSSTTVLLLATAKAARQFLSDDFQRVPAHKDVGTTGPNAAFSGDNIVDAISTTKAFGAPAQPSPMIESSQPAFDGQTEGSSTIDSDTTFMACDEDLVKDTLSGHRVSDTTDVDSEWLSDESTFYEDDCQATTQCLTDDKPRHTLHAEFDSHTINNLIRKMATLSLNDVPSHVSILSLDNVPTISTLSLDDVPSHIPTFYLDNVPTHLSSLSLNSVPSTISTLSLDSVPSTISTLSLDDVPSHLSTLPSHHILYDHTIDTIPDLSQPSKQVRSTLALDDHTIAHLFGTLPSDPPQSSKCQPQCTLVHDCPMDDLIRRMLDLSLDDVPSRLLTLQPHHALHCHPVDTLPNNMKALALDDDLAIDGLPKNADTLTLDDNHAIAIDALLQKSATLTLDDNHAIAIDALLQKLATLTLDDSYDIDMLPNNADALALDDNHAIAIDALPQKSATLTLDDNYDIDMPPNNTDALALNNHAIDARLQQSETLTLGDNASQSSKLQLLHNTNVFPLDSPSQSPEFQLQSTLHDDTIEMLLQSIDATSLDNDPFQSQPQHIPHDDTSQSQSRPSTLALQHSLRHDTTIILRNIAPLTHDSRSKSSEFRLRHTLHHDAIDTVLGNVELTILDGTPSQSPKFPSEYTALAVELHTTSTNNSPTIKNVRY